MKKPKNNKNSVKRIRESVLISQYLLTLKASPALMKKEIKELAK
jgi:hypothetical protein